MKKIKHIFAVIGEMWNDATDDFKHFVCFAGIVLCWFPVVALVLGYKSGISGFILCTILFLLVSFVLSVASILGFACICDGILYLLKGIKHIKCMWQTAEKKVLDKKHD